MEGNLKDKGALRVNLCCFIGGVKIQELVLEADGGLKEITLVRMKGRLVTDGNAAADADREKHRENNKNNRLIHSAFVQADHRRSLPQLHIRSGERRQAHLSGMERI